MEIVLDVVQSAEKPAIFGYEMQWFDKHAKFKRNNLG